MKFDEIDNLSEEQVLELYDEVLETNDKKSEDGYTMHVMCTDDSLQTGGSNWCSSYWRDSNCTCAYGCWYQINSSDDAYAAYVWSTPCTHIGKRLKKFCCD